jgi:hypothetical protein
MIDLTKTLQDYFSLQQQIYDYFGYVEDWVVIPIEDATEYYWLLNHDEEVIFAESEKQLLDEYAGDYYSNSIYKQRFLPKWVYRTDTHTMICVDTHTDGNKFLQIFDNTKEMQLSNGETNER